MPEGGFEGGLAAVIPPDMNLRTKILTSFLTADSQSKLKSLNPTNPKTCLTNKIKNTKIYAIVSLLVTCK